MKRLLLLALLFTLPARGADVSVGPAGSYFLDAFGYGAVLEGMVDIDEKMAVGLETGFHQFSTAKNRASINAAASAKSSTIPLLAAFRYRFPQRTEIRLALVARIGVTLLNEKANLTVGGVDTLVLDDSAMLFTFLAGVDLEREVSARVQLFASPKLGVVRDSLLLQIPVGIRFKF